MFGGVLLDPLICHRVSFHPSSGTASEEVPLTAGLTPVWVMDGGREGQTDG